MAATRRLKYLDDPSAGAEANRGGPDCAGSHEFERDGANSAAWPASNPPPFNVRDRFGA